MTVHDTLIRARALIADPKDWTQGNYTLRTGIDHICRCAVGAIAEVLELDPSETERSSSAAYVNREAAKIIGQSTGEADFSYHLVCLNDGEIKPTPEEREARPTFGTHDFVLLAFDRAIEATATTTE